MQKVKSLFGKQIIIPIVALIVLALVNLIVDPTFFQITLGADNSGNPTLSGSLITILNNGSKLAMLAIGMTLVTAASGGQDISVGATMTIAAAVVLRVVCEPGLTPEQVHGRIIGAFLLSVVAAMLCGVFNGILVAYFNIQPMVATLVLYTAGRHIASWINGGTLPSTSDPVFKYIGNFIPGLPIPTPILVTVVCIVIIFLVLRFTNLRLYTQAVGVNSSSARLNGLNPELIKLLAFIILGACVATAALVEVARTGTLNNTTFAKDIEMDAILAVAFGGNALSGGKFSMSASILGAYVLQFLTTTLYAFKVSPDALPAYKAIVIVILVVVSAPVVREKLSLLGRKMKVSQGGKEVA